MSFWAVAIIVYLATSALTFHLLLVNYRTFLSSIRSHLTNGDVVFCAIIAAIPVASLPAALIITAIEGYGPAGSEWANRRFRDRRPPREPHR